MTKAEREKAALDHRCPRGNVQAHFRCVTFTRFATKRRVHPHPERVALVPSETAAKEKRR